MKANKTYCKITTDETLRETVSHDSEEYPFCYYLEGSMRDWKRKSQQSERTSCIWQNGCQSLRMW